MREVGLRGGVVVADPPDAGTGGSRRGRSGDRGLDPVLHLVGELVPTRGEDLDAVVRHGVVRCGDHHAEACVTRSGEVRDRGGRQHADRDDVHTGGGQPGDDGRLEHFTARARVAPDDGDRMFDLVAGENPRRRVTELESQLGTQRLVRQPTNTVRTEQPTHSSTSQDR